MLKKLSCEEACIEVDDFVPHRSPVTLLISRYFTARSLFQLRNTASMGSWFRV
jgi:hypothetical protein